jgi:hypothetical protein
MHLLPRITLTTIVLLAMVTATPGSADGPTASVILEWTAPGDDGQIGLARAYMIRYSTEPITGANFDRATAVQRVPRPGAPGSRESFTVDGLVPDTRYYFALRTLDEAGNRSVLSNLATLYASETGEEEIPDALSFSAAWPNPARASVRCAFALPRVTLIEVEAFSVDGRRVRSLANAWHPPGRGEISWDLRDESGHPVPAGVYLIRARLGDTVRSQRVAVVR